MRKVRYSLVMSLDGRISGPKGENDWIVHNPEIDFSEIFSQFDTILVGRRTFDEMARAGRTSIPGMETIVFSKTLEQGEYPGVTVVGKDHKKAIDALRKQKGKDIWLFGGGSLFQSLLADKLVDTVEVSVMPVLLGGGTLLLPSPAPRTPLKLENYKVYKNGTVSLVYSIKRP